MVKVISLLKQLNISNQNIEKGLLNIKKNTGLTGRFQILSDSPKIICDVGHNLEAFQEILANLNSLRFDNLKFVLGFVIGKDFEKIIDILPKNAQYFFCKPNIKRGLSIKNLANHASNCGLKFSLYDSVLEAYNSSLSNSNDQDLIFIGGSNFIVSEIL